MPTLLEAVTKAAQELVRAERDVEKARAKLEAAVRRAADEGISLAKIERASGLGRQRVRTLAKR